ncbi:hypothetical protein LCGC14_1996570 [marine sediment metagenome]|uniref:Uncharacterized protein n=2 Tax=root TaxID=1 RepID=A0A0F9F4S7_9ZZZZ|nr:MAG: hypothetical protein LCMAC202_06060 [Marseillevirus LCMAC202]
MISYRTNVTVSAITLLIYAVATIIGISMLIEHAELEDYKVVIWPWCFTKIIWVGVGLVFVAYTMGYYLYQYRSHLYEGGARLSLLVVIYILCGSVILFIMGSVVYDRVDDTIKEQYKSFWIFYNVLFTLNLIEGVFAIGFIYRIWKDKWPRCLC